MRRIGKYVTCPARRCRAMILLDRDMPRKDGREALPEINRQRLRSIPVVVLIRRKPRKIFFAYGIWVSIRSFSR